MSAELATLNRIKHNSDMYCIDESLFDDINMLDISGIFPATDLTKRKIVLDLPRKSEFNTTDFLIRQGESGDSFGSSIDISDELIVVGNKDRSRIKVYNFNGDQIKSFQGSAGFGRAVAISNDTLVVGVNGDATYNGGIYLYDISNNWSFIYIEAPEKTNPNGALFGAIPRSIAFFPDGSKFVITARDWGYSGNSKVGKAYIYDKDGTQLTEIVSQIPVANSGFGQSVYVSDYIYISMVDGEVNPIYPGLLYRYDLDGTNEVIIVPSNSTTYANFGEATYTYRDMIVAGSSGDDNNGANNGAIHIIDKNSVTIQDKIIFNSPGSKFGDSIAIDERYFYVGAPTEEVATKSNGVIYKLDHNGTLVEKIAINDNGDNNGFGTYIKINDNHMVICTRC